MAETADQHGPQSATSSGVLLLLLLLLAYIALPFAQRLAFRCALQF